MIGRTFRRGKATAEESEQNTGFDAYELLLGDLMRGERATLGKSLLDVQRELKIKADYVAAIENADPGAFDTPGFIAGYVRSYARYLNMDPDWAFEKFCRESGFQPTHGMAAAALPPRASREARLAAAGGAGKDMFAQPATPFLPPRDHFLAGFEPRAAGSILVLALIVGGLGFGAWSVLQEVQKVEFAPVEQAPVVIAEVDPLAGAARGGPGIGDSPGDEVAFAGLPSAEALDRLYRPQALDLPVFTPRDGPIAARQPATQAEGSNAGDGVALALAEAMAMPEPGEEGASPIQVTQGAAPELQLLAARPAWVRVQAPDGSVLFEGILNPGDTWDVPVTEEPARLRVGESGALYFALNGVPYGPVGPSGQVTSNVALDAGAIAKDFAMADLTRDAALAEIVHVAAAQIAPDSTEAATLQD